MFSAQRVHPLSLLGMWPSAGSVSMSTGGRGNRSFPVDPDSVLHPVDLVSKVLILRVSMSQFWSLSYRRLGLVNRDQSLGLKEQQGRVCSQAEDEQVPYFRLFKDWEKERREMFAWDPGLMEWEPLDLERMCASLEAAESTVPWLPDGGSSG